MQELMISKVSPYAKEVALQLLAIRSITFDLQKKFTWASGIISPIYCDNRKINSNVKARNFITDILVKVIRENFPEVEKIAGVATGGIPLGALAADRMQLPFIYVRQSPKEHGLMQQVEGDFSESEKVVLIEDHISTGGSSMKAVQGLRNGGLNMLGLISIMTYGFKKADDVFSQNNVLYTSLCDLDTAVDIAVEEKKLTEKERISILEFRDDPQGWNEKYS